MLEHERKVNTSSSNQPMSHVPDTATISSSINSIFSRYFPLPLNGFYSHV